MQKQYYKKEVIKLTNVKKEILSIAEKAAVMKESSLKMLIFATNILLARDEMERESNDLVQFDSLNSTSKEGNVI